MSSGLVHGLWRRPVAGMTGVDLLPPPGAVLRFVGGVRMLIVSDAAARVLTGGRIAAGDAVEVLHASGSGASGR